MHRRDLIVGGVAIAGTGVAALAQVPRAQKAQLQPGVARIRPELIRRLCRKRPNINDLTPAQLTALKAGVTAMKARPATDPTSWAYQAGIHGANGTQRPLYGTCEHGSLHFLSWHRYYLYYFERILRAASGSSDLMLPYWDWTANRALPAPFRDNTAGNPLFESNRNNAVNGGSLLPASAVATVGVLANTSFNPFSSSLEGSPHGTVHTSVGGGMSGFNTAGLDPVFWLHHCNVDRLWEVWLAQGGGRANPATAAWRDRQFSFFDVGGVQRNVRAGGALATCSAFGYNYTGNRLMPIVFSQILATPLADVLAQQIRTPRGAVDTAPSLTLGVRAASATLALPTPARGAVPARTYLAFDDIVAANPDGYYEIYLNPRGSEDKLDFTDASYAGNLSLFGLTEADQRSMHAGHAGMADKPARRVFDITRKVAELAKARGFDPAKLRVVLVLQVPGGAPAAGAVDTPRVRIGKLRIISQ